MDYLEYLEKSGRSLIIYKDGEIIFESDSRGVRPHIEALEKLGRENLKGTIMLDKIVGRAAALLILYSGASKVYALLVSSGARNLLESREVGLIYREETPFIKVKDGVILCPFERMVQDVSDPEHAYEIITSRLSRM
ncbi:MAG: DUF1893 domain-containing protein [Candidatus Bathyarchaeia archaeon]